MELLSIAEVNNWLGKVHEWSLEDNGKSIVRNFEFSNLKEAVSFINRVLEISEEQEHHPNINIYDYSKIQVKASTNSVQGLTEKDFKLASEIDKI